MQDTLWWKGAIIYQIYPRSFQDDNSDGIGDLQGIKRRLPYVADLGVDGIWISPFYKSPMNDYGYDVSDFCDVDPMFGTLQDFKDVLDQAHDLGLKVIIDQVPSHTSNEHPWFQESKMDKTNPKADWYVWHDPKPDGSPPNNWLGVFGGIAWEYESRRGQYYLHNFIVSQPDLNLHNPEVQDAVLDNMRFWLDLGVDGFRLDVINMCMHDPEFRNNPPRTGGVSNTETAFEHEINTYEMQQHIYDKTRPENLAFIRRIRALCDEYKDIMTVGEIFDDHTARTAGEYTAGKDLLHTAYNFQLSGSACSAAHIKSAFVNFHENSPNGWPSWALSNHDWKRVASRWAIDGKHSIDQAKMLYVMECSLNGTIFVYQGEELGLPEAELEFKDLLDPFGIQFWPEYKGRDGCRTPMPWDAGLPFAGFSNEEPWLPLDTRHYKLCVAHQENNSNSMLSLVKQFLKWRKTVPELIHGTITFLDTDEPVLAFARDDSVYCYFNLGNTEQQVNVPENLTAMEGHGLPHTIAGATLTLPAFGGAFLKKG